MSRFKDIETLGVCASNSALFVSMLKTLKTECEEEGETELMPHIDGALEHLNEITKFFIGRQHAALKAHGQGRPVPIRVMGATNLHLVVNNTRKEK